MRAFFCLSFAASLAAQAPIVNAPATGFVDKTIAIDGREHRYVGYVPPGYTRERTWPLIVFLNGMGECGTDGRKHVEVGLGPAIRLDPVRWPFVVVFPQKPDKQSQWSEHEALVMGTLAATEKEYRIDPLRRFLTGLSQGGAGTWALGARHADVWAAIAPVCGYGNPKEVAAKLRAMPMWAFHGIDDKAVPAQQSKDLCAAVEKAGGTPVLTLYENTAHNSWDRAYRESALAEWLRVIYPSLTADERQATLAREGVLRRRHAALAEEWDLLHPESALGLQVFVAKTGRDGVRQVETLLLSNGSWPVGKGEPRPGWHVWRETWRGDAAVVVSDPLAVPAADGAKLLLECMKALVRAGLYEMPYNEGKSRTADAGVDSVGFDQLTGPGGRSLSYLPRHVRIDDPNRKLEREALLAVAARLRAVR